MIDRNSHLWKSMPLASRFWLLVQINGPDECWPWQGYIGTHGYGDIYGEGKQWTSHTLAFTLQHGPVPEGPDVEVCHSCHNRACCNGLHLSAGTRASNAAQMVEAGRHVAAMQVLERDTYSLIREACLDTPRRQVAQAFGVSRQHVDRIVKGYMPKGMN